MVPRTFSFGVIRGISMRILTLLVGVVAATTASAGELDAAYLESDAVTAQLVYQARFGGAAGASFARGFALQIANEGQRLAGVAPLRAEYRQDTGRFLVNGMDVEQAFVMRQGEEGGLAALWGGWLPLAIVIGAAGLIVVDGQDQEPVGSGASGS
jgi:hypothetical protein